MPPWKEFAVIAEEDNASPARSRSPSKSLSGVEYAPFVRFLLESSTSNRWTGAGTSNTIPRALGATQNVSASDRFIEDGSYTRLKNLSVGYTFDQEAFNNVFSKLRVYLSGQNLVTIKAWFL